MKTKKQKGFTLVELVIVIAVIAILAAVLIPTFSNLVKKANVSKDTQLVRNLNTALASDVKEHKTMTEALEAAEENGYDVSKINASATDNEILWDSVNDVFCYLNGKDMEYIPNTKVNEVKDYEYWQICTSIPSEQKYSIYWNSEEDFTATLKVGFDAGKNTTITSLRYENNNAQIVTIRTNGGTLIIKAPNDTVNHYGKAAEVFVEEINTASYHLFGKVDTLQIKKGHAVIENDAETTNVIVDNAKGETTSVDNKGTIKNVIGSSENVTGNAPSKEITNVNDTLTSAGGYVKLTRDQTISDDLTLANDTILDLNGKTITFVDGKKLLIEGNVTIMDLSNDQQGKIEYNYNGRLVEVKNGGELILNSGQICGEATEPHTSAFVRVYPNSALIVNGGTISYKAAESFTEVTSEGKTYSINLAATVYVGGNNAKLYVNGGVIESDTAAAISGNNQFPETFIEINGGIVKSKEAIAIYHPQTGTFNINGGYIEGATAIYQKCGTMTITGGTFKATGKRNAYEYMAGGADPTGDCIVIDSCKGYDDGGITTASISLENSNIIVVDKNASKVMGYVYENEEAVIVWNGEKVKSINVK